MRRKSKKCINLSQNYSLRISAVKQVYKRLKIYLVNMEKYMIARLMILESVLLLLFTEIEMLQKKLFLLSMNQITLAEDYQWNLRIKDPMMETTKEMKEEVTGINVKEIARIIEIGDSIVDSKMIVGMVIEEMTTEDKEDIMIEAKKMEDKTIADMKIEAMIAEDKGDLREKIVREEEENKDSKMEIMSQRTKRMNILEMDCVSTASNQGIYHAIVHNRTPREEQVLTSRGITSLSL